MNAFDLFNVKDFLPDLIPLDVDLLSLELNNTVKDLYLDGNLSVCKDSANAVMKLMEVFG